MIKYMSLDQAHTPNKKSYINLNTSKNWACFNGVWYRLNNTYGIIKLKRDICKLLEDNSDYQEKELNNAK